MYMRPYIERDRDACLTVLRSNTPEHFGAGDERDFQEFLDDLPGPYFVVEDESAGIIACGGIAEEADPAVATLCWCMVDSSQQRGGVGSALLKHRLATFLPEHPAVTCLRVNTTQKVHGFFERHGFRVIEVRRSAFGPDLDHVRMERTVPPTRNVRVSKTPAIRRPC